jgi:pimeloyl-ACP methyl ester carboxylesterase
LRRALRRTSRAGTFSGKDFRRYREAWAQPGALTAMLNWYRALRLPAASPAAARIRVPVRLIWGDRDAFLDRGLADAAIALCDQGEVFHLAEASHWLHHEEPDQVNPLLAEFLAD